MALMTLDARQESAITGTPCQHCDGWLVVYRTYRKGGSVVVRYFHCFRCKRTADETETVSLPKRRIRGLFTRPK